MRSRRKEREDRLRELRLVEAELHRVKSQWPRILQYAAIITDHVEHNHIAENLNALFRGDEKK